MSNYGDIYDELSSPEFRRQMEADKLRQTRWMNLLADHDPSTAVVMTGTTMAKVREALEASAERLELTVPNDEEQAIARRLVADALRLLSPASQGAPS